MVKPEAKGALICVLIAALFEPILGPSMPGNKNLLAKRRRRTMKCSKLLPQSQRTQVCHLWHSSRNYHLSSSHNAPSPRPPKADSTVPDLMYSHLLADPSTAMHFCTDLLISYCTHCCRNYHLAQSRKKQ